MSAKTLFLMVLFCIGLGLYLISGKNSERVIDTPVTDGKNDFYMQDFTLTNYDENGVLTRVITGAQMTRRTAGGESDITNPSAIIFQGAEPAWKVNSSSGTISGDQTQLVLRDQVRALQQPDQNLEIQTEQLTVMLDQQTARSDEEVFIVHTSGTQTGTGMTADLNQNELRLLSRVKGNYAHPQ